MTWSYRIVHHTMVGQEWFAIHEVYYDNQGKPWSMTEAPVTFTADSKDDIVNMLIKATREAQAFDVFEPPEVWPGKDPSKEAEDGLD